MILICGASATGKTEAVKKLVSDYGYTKLVTYTTRNKRENEINGIDYNFILKDDFINRLKNNFFFEYVEYNGNYYGTAFEDITDNKVVILEPNGLKKYINSNLNNIVSFYLDSTIEKRIDRMTLRGDSIESINYRKENDDKIFNLKTVEGVDFILDSDILTIDDLAKEINDLYKRKIN